MSSKKNNARIEKWRFMINEGLYNDPILLKSRIRKGIPTAMRSMAWPEIIKLSKFKQKYKNDYTFAKLVTAPSNATYQISLDIPRTFPEEQDSKVLRKSLNNVLKAISLVYPKVGYCQGMNFLTLRLLQIIEDEETFWIINYLLQKDPYLMKNFIDPKSIEQQSFVFHQIIKSYLPQVNQKFQNQNITVQIFTIKWFMTLFSSVLSQQLFYRVFQVYLNEGWTAIYAVGLTFLRINQEVILDNSFEENLLLINSKLYHVEHIDQFMQEVFKIQIPQIVVKQHLSAFKKIQNEKQKKKEGQFTRSRTSTAVKLRENQKPVLPVPQDEAYQQLKFESKSQQITFQVFGLLNETNRKRGN